jgi:hypothetical protein
MKNMTALYLRKSIGRLPWALVVCLTLATLGLSLSANAQERRTTFITFDAPGAIGTAAYAINPAGEIAGQYVDLSGVYHGLVRARNGAITEFDAPGAGTGPGQGTAVRGINPEGAFG